MSGAIWTKSRINLTTSEDSQEDIIAIICNGAEEQEFWLHNGVSAEFESLMAAEVVC